jgi:hypothetical protein
MDQINRSTAICDYINNPSSLVRLERWHSPGVSMRKMNQSIRDRTNYFLGPVVCLRVSDR